MKSAAAIGLLLLLLVPATGQSLEKADIPAILSGAAGLTEPGERVARISRHFLGTRYRANTLTGSNTTPEQLTVSLGAVDCFTLLDYVEALRRTTDPAEFRQRLIEVRYDNREISWATRRHFFTDWAADPDAPIADVTAEVGSGRAQQVSKVLNRREDGSLYLPGVGVRERAIHFIPTAAVGRDVLAGLQSGDYLGLYAAAPGLDVTHVGIAVRNGERWVLRHASSRSGVQQVIDEDLDTYLAGRPGIVILRPQPTDPR